MSRLWDIVKHRLVQYKRDPLTGRTRLLSGSVVVPTATSEPATFSQSIPLTGNTGMGQYIVAGAIAFVAPSVAYDGASCTVTLVADGVNTPTFGAFKKWGASDAYSNTVGAVNEVSFFCIGTRLYYNIGHATPLEIYFVENIVRFSSLTSMTETGDASAGWAYTTGAGNTVAKLANYSIPGNGYVTATVVGTQSTLLALDASNTDTSFYANTDFSMYTHSSGTYKVLELGVTATANVNAALAIVVGDKMKISRTTTTISMSVVRENGTEYPLHVCVATSAATLYPVLTGVNVSGMAVGPVKIAGGTLL